MTNEDRERKAFGARLKNAREAAGLLQTELANLLDAGGQTAISNWELGLRDFPITKVHTLCKTLGISPDYLFGLCDEVYRGIVPKKVDGRAVHQEMTKLRTVVRDQRMTITRMEKMMRVCPATKSSGCCWHSTWINNEYVNQCLYCKEVQK